jgi:hypothetical protein
MGMVRFADGSHRTHNPEQGQHPMAGQWHRPFQSENKSLTRLFADTTMVPPPITTGSVSLHDGWIYHHSRANESKTDRLAVIVVFLVNEWIVRSDLAELETYRDKRKQLVTNWRFSLFPGHRRQWLEPCAPLHRSHRLMRRVSWTPSSDATPSTRGCQHWEVDPRADQLLMAGERKDGSANDAREARPYAYVMLIFGSDVGYVAGAVMVAHRLRRMGTTADIVCLVTPDVATEHHHLLRKVCTRVLKVQYWHSCYVDWRHKLERWPFMSAITTKYHALRLTQYQKICLLDVDTVPTRNIDFVFDYTAPAGLFTSRYYQPNPLYDGVPNGGTISRVRLVVMANIPQVRRWVLNGSMMVLRPDLALWSFLQTEFVPTFKGYTHIDSGMDEQLITFAYTQPGFERDWTTLGQKLCRQWYKTHQRQPPVVNMDHVPKPWADNGNPSWRDNQWWRTIWHELVQSRPDLNLGSLICNFHAKSRVVEQIKTNIKV